MPNLELALNQGLNTAKDRADLGPGELQQATGIYYKLGDTKRAHKILGRSTFGSTGSAAAIKNMALCQFDAGGTDKLLAHSGTVVYSATPGATGTWASLITGWTSGAAPMSVCHANDRWYIGNGTDRNKVLLAAGTVRGHGMVAPQTAPTTTSSAAGSTVARPATIDNSGFTNSANANDASTTTFASATRSTAGADSIVLRGWVASAAASRTLNLVYALSGMANDSDVDRGIGIGGGGDSGYVYTIKIEVSTDNGGAYTTVSETTHTFRVNKTTYQKSITVNSDQVRIRVTGTYVSGTSTATLQIYDTNITAGGSGANFSTTTGLYYAISEFDQAEGITSAPGPVSDLETLLTENIVTITLPAAAQNTNATHWKIWRTFDGGTYPDDLYLIATIAIAETAHTDTFSIASTVTGSTSVPFVSITSNNGGTLLFPRDSSPAAASHMNAYKGSIVMVQGERTLGYTEAGYPDSQPEINVITEFPMPEHDELVATVTLGDFLLIAAKGLMMTMTDLPRVVQGIFNASEVTPLRGAPGCVGVKAITTFSVEGEARAAWVSPFGVYMTNGNAHSRLTGDLAWTSAVSQANLSTAVLHWNPDRSLLTLAYDSDGGGTNDRYLLFHMGPEHGKEIGPRVTGPHYGAINCMASGVVSGQYRQWSGHVSNGISYLEWDGTSDASQAYSSTLVPLIVTTGRMYASQKFFSLYTGNLYHTAAGGSLTISAATTVGWEDPGESSTETESVDIATQEWSDFYIGMGGSWAEITLTQTAAASFALGRLVLDIRQMGAEGRISA